MTGLAFEHKASPLVEGAASAFNASPSTLDRIRRKANEGADEHLDLLVPNYDGDVGVRYQAIDSGRFEELGEKTGLGANLDGLIAACQCILIRGDGGLEPLTKDGDAVTFAYGLDEVLGLPADCSTRDVVLKLFSRVPSPHLAAAKHAALIARWMAGERVNREESLLGES